jgi:hypothetical protein
MNTRKRAILRQRGGEIAKAGRMFFDAVFGDSEKFFREKGAELEHELAERGAIVVDGELVDDDPSPSPRNARNRGR